MIRFGDWLRKNKPETIIVKKDKTHPISIALEALHLACVHRDWGQVSQLFGKMNIKV